jgi:hypothetical protein
MTSMLGWPHGYASDRESGLALFGEAERLVTYPLDARLTVPDVLAELPWHAAVLLPDAMFVTETSSALAAVRASAL